jgi:imidazolonepropionase-like amidohydrolase
MQTLFDVQPLKEVLVPGAHPVWVRVGTLLDGLNAPRKNVHLVYDAKSILYVGEQPPPLDLVGGRIGTCVELDDLTVFPGLIDAHTHLFLDGAPVNFEERKQYLLQSPEWQLERAKVRMSRLVRMGVLGVRDAGDKVAVGLRLQAMYRARKSGVPIPYLDSPGAAIHHKGRYGSFMADPIENYASPADCVRSRKKDGAHRIKLIPTGIINFEKGAVTTPPQMTLDELNQFVEAAKAEGMQTFAHASGADGIQHGILAGVSSIEHGFFVTDEQLQLMRDRQVAWVPTFIPVQVQIDRAGEMGWKPEIVDQLKRIIDGHRRSLARASKMGVRIVAGSDAGSCGVAHGLGFYLELEAMQLGGMSEWEVLNAATGASYEAFSYQDPIGILKKGFKPRMVFTQHSPLTSLKNLSKPKWVVFDGGVVEALSEESEGGL